MVICISYSALFLAEADLFHVLLVQVPREFSPAYTLQGAMGNSSTIAITRHSFVAQCIETPLLSPIPYHAICNMGMVLMSYLAYAGLKPNIMVFSSNALTIRPSLPVIEYYLYLQNQLWILHIFPFLCLSKDQQANQIGQGVKPVTFF